MKNFFYILADARCYVCGYPLKSGENICDDCLKLFKQDIREKCPVCGHPIFDGEHCISCSKLGTVYFDSYKFVQLYYNYCKQIVVNCKKSGDRGGLSIYIRLLDYFKMLDKNIPITLVPDNFVKRYYKGGAGFHTLAGKLRRSGYQIKDDILRKKFITGKQKLKSVSERIKGIDDNFYLNPRYKKGTEEHILLLDDIYTTGATVNCCAKLLKNAGYKKVYVVTLFRTYIDLMSK